MRCSSIVYDIEKKKKGGPYCYLCCRIGEPKDRPGSRGCLDHIAEYLQFYTIEDG